MPNWPINRMATQPVTGEAKVNKLDTCNANDKYEKDYKEPKKYVNN